MTIRRQDPKKISSIDRQLPADDVLRNDDYARVAELQQQAWAATQAAQQATVKLLMRIRQGAQNEATLWTWDDSLHMVRSIKPRRKKAQKKNSQARR